MFHYTAVQWVFFFYLYCFLGWCFESAYVSICDRKLTNRGFMRGPILPIYGSGAMMMLVVSMPFQDNILLTYLAGCVGATVLELVTGLVMEALFKVRYWDYSDKKLNFKGHICLSSTLTWGFFTILMTEVIQVRVEKVILFIAPRPLAIATLFLTALIFSDFALSFKTAIDLRDMLEKMEQARDELLGIKKRLEQIVANTSEGMSNKKDELKGSLSGLKAHVGNMLSKVKTSAQAKALDETTGEELTELKTKYAVLSEVTNRLTSIKDIFLWGMLVNNPLKSGRFAVFIDELKKKASGEKEEE